MQRKSAWYEEAALYLFYDHGSNILSALWLLVELDAHLKTMEEDLKALSIHLTIVKPQRLTYSKYK